MGGLQRLGQLLAVKFSFLLLLFSQFVLLLPVEVVEQNAKKKRRQHGDHHDDDILVNGSSLLLNGLHRHISHQENSSTIYRPHIVEGVYPPDIVVKKEVFPIL